MKGPGCYARRAVWLAVIGLYCGGAVYLAPRVGRWLQAGSARQGSRGDRGANGVNTPTELAASWGGTLARSLPQDWQADCRGGKLWITHYNPDGTVADCLIFGSLGDCYDWIDTHPDFCDVHVEKPERAAPRTAAAPDTAGQTPGHGDKSSVSAMAAECVP